MAVVGEMNFVFFLFISSGLSHWKVTGIVKMRPLCNCEAKSAKGLKNKQPSFVKTTQGVAVRGDNKITPFGRFKNHFEMYWTERTDNRKTDFSYFVLSKLSGKSFAFTL